MILGPSLSLAAAPRLRRAAAAGRVVPDGLIPGPQARLDDFTGWVLDGGGFVAGTGEINRVPNGSQGNASYDVAVPAGNVWIAYTVTGATAGTVGAQLVAPFTSAPFQNRVTAQHVARFTSVGHTRAKLSANGTFNGTIEDFQVVDMTALLAQPSDIYIAAGQSLMAAEGTSAPVDPQREYWLPRCLYLPGSSNTTYGTNLDTVAACAGPLQMVQTCQGVSPALSFARRIEAATAPGRTVLIVACARGSSRLVGTDAEWNPAGSTSPGGTLYAGMVSQVGKALARVPGSQVKGLLWAQGESDRSATMDVEYPPAFQAMLSQLRSDLSEPALPAVIVGPMPDDASPLQPLYRQTQERLDQDSGHATAIPGVHYVARTSGHMSGDGTHPTPEGNRIAGRLAAERFIAQGYL